MVVCYIDASVLLENTALVKFIRNHIWYSGGVFSIITDIMIVLKLYLNLLLYGRNIFGFSLKVFGNFWLSPEILRIILRKIRKVFGNDRVDIFWKHS